MGYKPGDRFIHGVMKDYSTFGHAFIYVEDNEDYYYSERIPPSLVLGGMYYA